LSRAGVLPAHILAPHSRKASGRCTCGAGRCRNHPSLEAVSELVVSICRLRRLLNHRCAPIPKPPSLRGGWCSSTRRSNLRLNEREVIASGFALAMTGGERGVLPELVVSTPHVRAGLNHRCAPIPKPPSLRGGWCSSTRRSNLRLNEREVIASGFALAMTGGERGVLPELVVSTPHVRAGLNHRCAFFRDDSLNATKARVVE
jgi:hypothetical protein